MLWLPRKPQFRRLLETEPAVSEKGDENLKSADPCEVLRSGKLRPALSSLNGEAGDCP